MAKYATKVTTTINGSDFSDFSSFEEGETNIGTQVELMNKTGWGELTERYTFTVTVMYQADTQRIHNLRDATFVVAFNTGQRFTYSGCYPLTKGAGSLDGTTPLSQDVTFMAENLVEE
jgi:hypothetical protein